MDYTINLIWVVLAALTLLIAIIGSIIKSSREAERFESWLKTHEKEITEIKRKCDAQEAENKLLKESITNQNSISMQESRRLETMIGQLSQSIAQIDVKLSFIIEGKIKTNVHEG